MAAEAFAFQSKNHPVPLPTAWFVPNGGSGAVVFLVVLTVALPTVAFVLAVALPAAAVEAKARITTVNNTAGLDMAGIWKNSVIAAPSVVDSASLDAN